MKQGLNFYVKDFNNPGKSDAQAIQAAIDAAVQSGGNAIVVLENKTYHIDRTIKIENCSDITIDGNGAMLIMTKYIMAINVNNAVRVNILNMTFDYDPLPFTQGEVVNINLQDMTWEVKIDDGYPINEEFAALLVNGYSLFLLVDEKKRIFKENSYEPYVSKIDFLSDRLIRITDKNLKFVENLALGDVLAMTSWHIWGDKKIYSEFPNKNNKFFTLYHWQHSVIRLFNTEECCTEHLTFYTGPSTIYEMTGKGGNRHTNNIVRPGPRPIGATRDRQLSATLDNYESVSMEKGPLIENWNIERTIDDPIVLFGLFSKIIDQPEPDTILVTPLYRNLLAVDDLIEVRDKAHTIKGTALITDIQTVECPELSERNLQIHEKCWHPFPWTPNIFLKIKLDKNVLTQPGDRIIALNRRNQGAIIRNNRMRGFRAQGLRIQGADVLIENNYIENSTMTAIMLTLEREELMMGAPCNNIIIRGNRIINPATYSVPTFYSKSIAIHAGIRLFLVDGTGEELFWDEVEKFSENICNQNIIIEDNIIENSPYYAIFCANAKDVVIKNNIIRNSNMREPHENALGFAPDSAILVAASDNVEVKDNSITFGEYTKEDIKII